MDISKIKTGEQFLNTARREGATVSDGPIPGFTRGWGHQINFKTPSMIAHYWTKVENPTLEAQMVAEFGERAAGAAHVTSECGLRRLTTNSVPTMGPGNMPFCARCENTLMRKMKEAGNAE